MSKKSTQRKTKSKHLTLIRNENLLKKERDNKYLAEFLTWIESNVVLTETDIINVIKILIQRELKRKR